MAWVPLEVSILSKIKSANSLAVNWTSNGMDNLIIFGAKYLIFIVGAVVLAVWAKSKGKTKYEFALLVILAGVSAVILSKLASQFYFHHRPFVLQNIKPLVSHGDDNGFPSDHTTVAFALAVTVYFYRKRVGTITFVLAVFVGIARVAAHVHSPIDVLGGAILGLFAGAAGYWLAKRFLAEHTKPPMV